MITANENAEFWILSDTHLIADSLHDNGQAFSRMQKTSQGKDLYHQETALKAFVKMAEEKKPAAIIVTGDVTFNGELLSAKKFAKIFSPLTATKLLLIPGNHDIYDGWARKFINQQQLLTEQISPQDWQNIFHQSYEDCISQDPHSLAYSVQFNPHYLFLMLDSNYYGDTPSTSAPLTRGYIKQAELNWLQKQLAWAKAKKLRPILFMHHNLYVHNIAVNHGFVLDNAEQVQDLYQRYDVKLAFSGHIHAQNVVDPHDGLPTTEVASSSFCSYDQGYGIVQVHPEHLTYIRKEFAMQPYLSRKKQTDYTLMHFHDYLKKLQFANIAADIVQKEERKGYHDLQLIRKMGNLFASLNFNFFTGHNHLSAAEVAKLKASTAYQTLVHDYPAFVPYLSSLYDTSQHSNLYFKIKY